MIRRFIKDERGTAMVEYAMILACIMLVMLIGFSRTTDALAYLWGNNNSRLIQVLSTDQ
ncbi:Flp family type IVb pilin [Tianweitania sp. BSSL-BM11]|uniref:Flp family type IVb pilin n=1 Tax=Tianweitania aestuarii TaxID=2814886 RepID=A0ABS5RZD3_9HYPH|nr:Flp family type IVb pilin [Tianweitania aestuarii]MBS9722406.1 Flp family type IVb pilin [Tianweitania aestuarii]